MIIFIICAFPVSYSQTSNTGDEGTAKSYISTVKETVDFILSAQGKSAPLYISTKDYPGVIRALRDLQSDIKKVTNAEPQLSIDKIPSEKEIVIVGTLGKSPVIDELVSNKKLNVENINGKWESYLIQVVKNPLPGVEKALVITGSDKRGTIYGIYDISHHIGVSPWYWWADVPVEHKDNLYVKPEKYEQGPPSVKYRGIFLNDEYPDLTNWIIDKYGFVTPQKNPPIPEGVANYNHLFYTKLFELILRLRGNYLWPAMWNNAFNEDDPQNPKLADMYGIVMGTSHQEPMMRAQKEWDRRYLKTLGTWNYVKYPDTLNKFWREGIRRNKDYENIITIGLRGANDTPMAPGGPDANMDLLEKIVAVQRKIISEETKKDVTKVPQMWCLYKEVMGYYNAGMRVPNDVTLLWAEDNWGNVRRLPTPEERKRSGGAGIYYHFDYHGGPRSYQWINTNPIPKIWDQMSLSKQYGADRIWIVNVGHFKGYEFPLEYFMNLAWNTDKWTNKNINEYTKEWAAFQFGPKYAKDIADIIVKYTKYNGRRKPELLSSSTYSLINYREAETVVKDYNAIAAKAEEIYKELPEGKRPAFYELVLFPAKACSIVNQLYYAAGRNEMYAKQGRAATNDMAEETRSLFKEDTTMMGYFNRS
ncbi:MAG: glycosyl hydrolase 115 family protein, partial [Ignavibacteriaceae bacterium]